MIEAYLYNADGHDQRMELDERCVADLGERSLLWVDVLGRDRAELDRLARLFDLDPSSIRSLLRPQDDFYVDNYGDYFQFDVLALAPADAQNAEDAFLHRHPVHLEFLVGPRWVITVHEEELPFFRAFRAQDKGETLIGALTAPALAASLLDWHLTGYFEAIAELEASVDRLDDAILTRSAKRTLLAGIVALRRRVAQLRRLLVAQRVVFYGLSRPDFAHAVEAAAHYRSLERRFERSVDAADHARELVDGSFELFTTRTAESTNVLVRRLTFITMLLGAIGAVAGIFGMNFDTPYARSGLVGFWLVVGGLIIATVVGVEIARRRNWL